MINYNIDSLIEDYISIVSQYDYKLGKETHRIYKQLERLDNEILKFDSEELKYFLDNILSCESLSVQLHAATLAIENQYRTDEAKNIILNIREMNVKEANGYAPMWALSAITEYLFDERYPYICSIFHQTSALMKESILKDSIDKNKCNKIDMLISKQDVNLVKKYIDFLNNRKHDGCFMYYGALLAFKYNYHIKEARSNLTMISKDNLNWGKMSQFCLNILNEHRSI